MANNYRVDVINQDTQRLFVRLRGDFDGSSAYHLLRLINNGRMNNNSNSLRKIMIDTSALRNIHSFGSGLLLANIKSIQNRGADIVFIGRFKRSFAID